MKKSGAKLIDKLVAQAAGFTEEDVAKLRKLVKKGPVDFAELCDEFELPPKKMGKLLTFAREQGITVQTAGNRVGIDRTETASSITDTGVMPTVGQEQIIGVISDLHLGSRYVMRPQLIDFVEHAYKQGVREILIPGDLLEGCYRHAQFEVTHVSLEDQAQDLCDTLPRKKGLRYFFITGNHDETFWDKTGVHVGRAIMSQFQHSGRTDLTFLGDRDAFIKMRGVVINLWHPKQGAGYAKSYALQNKVGSYTTIKPQILLVGHWHIYCHVHERGVHAIAAPTMQGSGSKFGKSLRGGTSHGGLILKWKLTEHGTMRDFTLAPRFYYEHEAPVEYTNELDAIQVEPQVYGPATKRRTHV